MSIKVVITDDHLLLINGLVDALRQYEHIEVTNIYTTGGDLLKGLGVSVPDVLLLDLHLPDIMGNDLAGKLRKSYPDMRILILTGMESAFHVKDVMQQGCMGYLLKTATTPDMLAEAIEKVYAGETFIDEAIKDQLVNKIFRTSRNSGSNVPLPRLSQREREVLQLIAAQYSNQQIAERLFLSQRTVENHRFNLMQKLGVKNTAGLLMKAVQFGILE